MNTDVAIIVNYYNHKIAERTLTSFPSNVKVLLIDGRYGCHGLESLKLIFKKKLPFKWVFLIDEDVILTENFKTEKLISEMTDREIDILGVRDGGILSMRRHNPFLPNTFFCILNYAKMVDFYDEDEIDKNNFISEGDFNDLPDLPFDYDQYSLYEPYYRFFLFYERKGMNLQFLEAVNLNTKEDNNTTFVYDKHDDIIAIHTWRSRYYGKDKFQTDRIDKVLNRYLSKSRIEIQNLEFIHDSLLLKIRFRFITKKIKNQIKTILKNNIQNL